MMESGSRAMPDQPEIWLPTRGTLLSRLKNWNDQESWREFFDRYWRFIYSVALRAGLTDTEAEEVVQETVITVAKQMPGFKYDRSKGSFKGWLQKTTRWKILAQLRKRQANQRFADSGVAGALNEEGASETIDPGLSDLEARWQEEWEQNLMEVALERVKRLVRPREFQVFDFCTVKEWPVAKVATHLNLIRPQVYYLNKKLNRMIRNEIRSLRAELE